MVKPARVENWMYTLYLEERMDVGNKEDQLNNPYNGFLIYPKSSIVKAIPWENGKNVETCEKFLEDYPDYSFEYTSLGGWILKWRYGYKTMTRNTCIIKGYKQPIVVDDTELQEKYNSV